MDQIRDKPAWEKASLLRKRQRLLGRLSAIFLAVALLALVDGLVAQMRSGSNELELLPGQAESISGPSPLKHPLDSDLGATFTPQGAPLRFEAEGFFSGYWFGSGMWRGKVIADNDLKPGTWTLRIAFKGASAQTVQTYSIRVFANRKAWRQANLSLLQRWLDLPPFLLAAASCGLGVILGFATYFFGRNYGSALSKLGLAQTYAVQGNTLWCLVPATLAPRHGNVRMVLDQHGNLLGEARVEEWQKGKLRLTLMDGPLAIEEALVCISPPRIAQEHNLHH